MPAAWLIEQAGFQKGHADGAAAISTKHPLAIVNRGGATARDVLRLASRIKRRVMDRFGVSSASRAGVRRLRHRIPMWSTCRNVTTCRATV